MTVNLSVAKNVSAVDLNFNQALGIKPLNIKNKFIGINTKDAAFQNLFGDFKTLFKGGYTKTFSKGFGIGPIDVDVSADLILGRVYANVGVNVSAGFDLGHAIVGLNTAGSISLSGSVPNPSGGILLSAKTLSEFGGTPKVDLKLPTAFIKADILADIDIATAAIDASVSAKWRRFRAGTDLPRLQLGQGFKGSINKKDRNKNPIPLTVLDYTLQSVLDGTSKNLFNPKQKQKKALFETEYKGVRFTTDLRNVLKNIKTSSGGTKELPSVSISGEIPIISVDAALARVVSNINPKFKLLSQRFTGNGYDVNYKLIDFSVGSNLKLMYSGTVRLSGRYSRLTFENGSSMTLAGQTNGLSSLTSLSSTTSLKRVLDANGDGRADIKFDWGYNNAGLALDYGLYANIFGLLEAGKLKAEVGAEFKIGFGRLSKNIGFTKTLVNTTLYRKQYQLTKDLKILGGSKTVGLNANPYKFSDIKSFNLPANADDLIGILGLDPVKVYTVRGTSAANNLVTRTERGNDTFIGGDGRDTMAGGLGDDTYYLRDAYFVVEDGNLDVIHDLVIEDANAGLDTIVYDGAGSFSLENYLNVEVLDLRTTDSDRAGATGNSLDNTIYASEYQRTILEGRDGNDILIGKSQDDELNGGDGNDILVGGGGINFFVFDPTRLANNSVDTIKDFQDVDVIEGFTGYDGIINRNDLILGTAATTPRPSLIYNQSTGQLFADFDGTGSNQPQLFAILENRPTISSQNFF